jgi:hypothetical protein
MTRTERRHPERFPLVSRKFLGSGKKELKAYLKGKQKYISSYFYYEGIKHPNYSKVRQQKQVLNTK